MKADKSKSHLRRTYLLLRKKKKIGYFKKSLPSWEMKQKSKEKNPLSTYFSQLIFLFILPI